EEQVAAERNDEGWYLQEGYPVALEGTDEKTGDHGKDNSREEAEARIVEDGPNCSGETCDRADRQVDVADDNHQNHTRSENEDIANLHEEIGEVPRVQVNSSGQCGEAEHDDGEHDEHRVVSQVIPQDLPDGLGGGLKLIHCCSPGSF